MIRSGARVLVAHRNLTGELPENMGTTVLCSDVDGSTVLQVTGDDGGHGWVRLIIAVLHMVIAGLGDDGDGLGRVTGVARRQRSFGRYCVHHFGAQLYAQKGQGNVHGCGRDEGQGE